MHDSYESNVIVTSYDNYKFNKEMYNLNIIPFFVGLFEADGSLSTDMLAKPKSPQSARIRMIIALKRSNENINMLNLIKQKIGGRVVLEKKKDYEYVV